jgi:hypothetical protein
MDGQAGILFDSSLQVLGRYGLPHVGQQELSGIMHDIVTRDVNTSVASRVTVRGCLSVVHTFGVTNVTEWLAGEGRATPLHPASTPSHT